ncbi:unnamed protein product [Symbiodinium natans]|uniref:Uncharacterized protein n=1 Tax=Symbiodinium natans TaxID=878477 RepID=A0A812MYH2_9DINO|nr:unnamed protein product [Symbiodinium natans]
MGGRACCKYCCLFFPPILVALYLGGWKDQPPFVRVVGKTPFAWPENYEAFTLTDRQREEFFRDGATLLKGVLKPTVIKELHKIISPIPRTDPQHTGNLWMLHDELLDFYLHGPLADIARQLFESPQAVTAHLPPSAQIQRDFFNIRNGDSTNGWHIDRTECQRGDQPSKFLSTALARLAVPLILEGGVRGTQIINQSKYAAAMSEKDREAYFAGKAMYRKEGRFEDWMGWDTNTSLPVLPGVTLTEDMIMEPWMEPGDVVVFNTCLWHRSPPWTGPEPELGLHPTFAPSTHVNHDPPAYTDPMGTWCLNDDFAHQAIGEGPSPCFPHAYPEEKRPKNGSTLTLQRRPMALPRHLLISFLGVRFRDQLRKVFYR